MAKILITSGPTRQYLDPIRYLTNASSGRMGAALAQAALEAGYEVAIVTGPVEVEYPKDAIVKQVVSTEQMKDVALELFGDCEGAIGAAAPCDYQTLWRRSARSKGKRRTRAAVSGSSHLRWKRPILTLKRCRSCTASGAILSL